MADQLAFAALSGDHNPIHIDALAARRTQAGAPVVHGMHLVMWALDALAAGGLVSQQLRGIRAQFHKFTYLDIACDVELSQLDSHGARIDLCSNGLVLATIQLRNGGRRIVAEAVGAAYATPATEAGEVPLAPSLPDVAGWRGWVTVPGTAAQFEAAFPALVRVIGARRAAGLATLSRLVGMVCPGLHSIFAGFDAALVEPVSQRIGVSFEVTKLHQQYRMIGMNVGGDGLSGTATTFMRWPPVEAPAMSAIAAAVTAGKFAGAVALVIGGSRGLGAVTAKVIAAGGGRVIITYAKGADDAARLAAEINAARGPAVCTALAYDSLRTAASQLAALNADVNQLYYFATPPILAGPPDQFSPERFREFRSVYVDGFDDACRFVRTRSRVPLLAAFYPSSVYVTEAPPGLAEYASAKAEGEQLCATIGQQIPGLKVVIGRLPRVLTDQTATIARVDNADPLTVMLPFVNQLQEPA